MRVLGFGIAIALSALSFYTAVSAVHFELDLSSLWPIAATVSAPATSVTPPILTSGVRG